MDGLDNFLCHIDEIPDNGSKGLNYKGMALVAVRQGDQVYLYHNQCPHLGLPLEWQADQFLNADKSLIQCSTHGALFEIESGYCISGPCQRQKLVAINTNIEDGFISIK